MPVNVFFFLLLVITGFAYAAAGQTAAGIFFIAASLLACLLFIFRIEDSILRYIILAALVVRVGLALLQAYTGIDLPGAGADSTSFEKYGWQNARAWLYGEAGGSTSGAYIYSAWIGLIYVFFGRFEFIPQLVNVYFSLGSIYMIYRAGGLVFSSVRISRIAALLLALMPAINGFSAILLRESMIFFFMFLSFYFLIKWTKEGRLLLLAWSFLAMVAAGFLHGVLILLFAIHLLLICIYSPGRQKFRLVLWQLIPAAVFVGLISMLLGEYITYQLPGNIADILTPDFMRNVVERKTTGRSSYLLETVPYTYFDLMWQTPLRVLYFLFAPFPWMLGTFSDLLGFIDVLIYIFLFYFAFKGARRAWRSDKHVVVASTLIAICLVVMFSWGTTNYGTAWRHRQKIAPFVIVLASAGVAASPRFQRLCDNQCRTPFVTSFDSRGSK